MGQIIELILRIRIDKKTLEQQMLDLNFVDNGYKDYEMLMK